MQTRTGFTTAARAETLARLLHGKLDEGEGRALERVERVAHAVGTDRRRAMVWVRQTLAYEGVTRPRLLGLGFEWWVVNAADILVVRPREDVPAYAKRVAACTDADVLAVAGAAIDDEIREGVERQHDSRPAYEEARLVVQRAADALANEQPGAFPAAGGMADNLPTAPALRTPLLSFVDHTNGVQQAMADMMRGPGKVPCAVFAPVSGGPGTAGRQTARPDLRRRSVGGRRERAERGHVRGESDPGQVQDGNGAEARHRAFVAPWTGRCDDVGVAIRSRSPARRRQTWIDLSIALEALSLDNEPSELRFPPAAHGAWSLGAGTGARAFAHPEEEDLSTSASKRS